MKSIIAQLFSSKEIRNSMHEETKESILWILRVIRDKKLDLSDFELLPPCSYVLLKIHAEKNEVNLRDFSLVPRVSEFLERVGFFDSDFQIKRKTVLPLSTVNFRWDEEEISSKFRYILENCIYQDDSLLNSLSKIIWEGIQNIVDHSWDSEDNMNSSLSDGMKYNYSTWLYFPRKEFIQIVIADGGRWILSSLRRSWKNINDTQEAIGLALKAWVSGWKSLNRENREFTQISNRWIGLTTSKEIIKKLKWDFFIWTRDKLYCYCGKNDTETYVDISGMSWVGTFLVFNIYSWDNLNDLDININELEEIILNSIYWGDNSEWQEINIDFR